MLGCCCRGGSCCRLWCWVRTIYLLVGSLLALGCFITPFVTDCTKQLPVVPIPTPKEVESSLEDNPKSAIGSSFPGSHTIGVTSDVDDDVSCSLLPTTWMGCVMLTVAVLPTVIEIIFRCNKSWTRKPQIYLVFMGAGVLLCFVGLIGGGVYTLEISQIFSSSSEIDNGTGLPVISYNGYYKTAAFTSIFVFTWGYFLLVTASVYKDAVNGWQERNSSFRQVTDGTDVQCQESDSSLTAGLYQHSEPADRGEDGAELNEWPPELDWNLLEVKLEMRVGSFCIRIFFPLMSLAVSVTLALISAVKEFNLYWVLIVLIATITIGYALFGLVIHILFFSGCMRRYHSSSCLSCLMGLIFTFKTVGGLVFIVNFSGFVLDNVDINHEDENALAAVAGMGFTMVLTMLLLLQSVYAYKNLLCGDQPPPGGTAETVSNQSAADPNSTVQERV